MVAQATYSPNDTNNRPIKWDLSISLPKAFAVFVGGSTALGLITQHFANMSQNCTYAIIAAGVLTFLIEVVAQVYDKHQKKSFAAKEEERRANHTVLDNIGL